MRTLFLLICLFVSNLAFSQDFGGTLSFKEKGKYGLVDSLGNVILPAVYESVRVSDDKKYVALRRKFNSMEGKSYSYTSCYDCGSIDRGDPYVYYRSAILNTKLDTVFRAQNDIYTYENYYFIGDWDSQKVLNYKLEEIHPLSFQSTKFITQPYSGLWYHTSTGFSGVLDKDGNQLMKEMPLWIQPVTEDLFVAQVERKHFFLDKKLKKVNDFSFNRFEILNKNILLFEIGKQHQQTVGLMNTKGKIILPAEYRQISYNEKNEVYIVRTKEYQVGLLNKKFKNIVPFEYNMIKECKDSDLFMVYKDKKYGFVNSKGKMVIPMIYDGADVFSEGLAPVHKDGKWGFINEKDEVVMNFQFVGIVKSFENGYAQYLTNYYGSDYETTYIKKDGTFAGAFVRGELEYFSKEKAILKRERAKYLIDIKTGEIIFRLY